VVPRAHGASTASGDERAWWLDSPVFSRFCSVTACVARAAKQRARWRLATRSGGGDKQQAALKLAAAGVAVLASLA